MLAKLLEGISYLYKISNVEKNMWQTKNAISVFWFWMGEIPACPTTISSPLCIYIMDPQGVPQELVHKWCKLFGKIERKRSLETDT